MTTSWQTQKKDSHLSSSIIKKMLSTTTARPGTIVVLVDQRCYLGEGEGGGPWVLQQCLAQPLPEWPLLGCGVEGELACVGGLAHEAHEHEHVQIS